KRTPAFEDAKHVQHDKAERRALGELGSDGERPIEGHTRIEKRRKFLREEQDIAPPPAAELGQLDLESRALRRDSHVNGSQPLLAQLTRNELIVFARKTAGADLAIGCHSAKEKSRCH